MIPPMRRRPITLLLLLVAVVILAGGKRGKPAPAQDPDADLDLDAIDSLPTVEDLGYFLTKLGERQKSAALNVLIDLASDSRLDRADVTAIFHTLVDEGTPPPQFGYGCATCFQRKLSEVLSQHRLKGPKVAGPQRGVIVMPVNDRFLSRIDKEASAAWGGSVPAFVQALLDGYDPSGSYASWAYPRYHGKGADVRTEPLFFTSAEALSEHESTLGEPLDAWSLSKFMCTTPPRNRFDPGYLVLTFNVTSSCSEVRIPTAADGEDPDFRPTPASERDSGRTCGGAPEWVCPNFKMNELTGVRYVANAAYVKGMR